MACIIGHVTTHAVAVSWKDQDGAAIVNGESEGYIVVPGAVDPESGEQEAVLIITSSILYTLGSSVTYTCAAQSIQYSESPKSPDQNVVLTLLTFGKVY